MILCDGKSMLIDGGESSQSSKVYAYLDAHEVDHLDYIVATHAYSDHVGGLSGALNYASVDTALCPVTEYDSDAFRSFVKYLGSTEKAKFYEYLMNICNDIMWIMYMCCIKLEKRSMRRTNSAMGFFVYTPLY